MPGYSDFKLVSEPCVSAIQLATHPGFADNDGIVRVDVCRQRPLIQLPRGECHVCPTPI